MARGGLKIPTWLIAVGLIVILLWYFGYFTVEQATVVPGVTPTPSPAGGTLQLYGACQMRWTIHNIVTGDDVGSGCAGYNDIYLLTDGVFDPLKKMEGLEYDASPDTSALSYAQGSELVFRVTSDKDYQTQATGNETYTRWFYIANLFDKAPVKEITLNSLQPASSSPSYTYRVNDALTVDTGWRVNYEAGTTPYWGLGAFELYPRIGDSNLDISIEWAGTTLTAVTDGSTMDDSQAKQNSDVTLTTDSEDMHIRLLANQPSLCYGLPQLVVQESGKIVEYKAVIVIATNATAIGVDALVADGFMPVNKVDITAEMVFYKVLDPIIVASGRKFDKPIEFSIDASSLAASTAYCVKAWVMDWQLPSNVAIGSTSASLPTAYGVTNDMGCDDIIFAVALTVSSGATATPHLFGDFTTAA